MAAPALLLLTRLVSGARLGPGRTVVGQVGLTASKSNALVAATQLMGFSSVARQALLGRLRRNLCAGVGVPADGPVPWIPSMQSRSLICFGVAVLATVLALFGCNEQARPPRLVAAGTDSIRLRIGPPMVAPLPGPVSDEVRQRRAERARALRLPGEGPWTAEAVAAAQESVAVAQWRMKTLPGWDLLPDVRTSAAQLAARLAHSGCPPVRRVRDLPTPGRIALERATRGEPVADFDGPFSGGCIIEPGKARLCLEVAAACTNAGLALLLSGGFTSGYSVLLYDASGGVVTMIVQLGIDPRRKSDLRVLRALHDIVRSDKDATDPREHARNATLLLSQVQEFLRTTPEPISVLIPAP